MSHKIKFKKTVINQEDGIDTIQHSYNDGNGFTEKSNIKFTSAGNITFNTPSNDNILVVGDNGNVGIGKFPESNYKLDINGSARIEDLVVESVTTTSDRRKKMNIEPIAKYELDELRPVQYNWKRKPDGNTVYGFIAQEIEETYPNIVKTDQQGFYSIDYLQLIPISVKNLQIQDELLQGLKKEVVELKEQLELLKKANMTM